MNRDLRNMLFEKRGITPVPLIVYLLIRARPSYRTIFSGAVMVLFGEWLRLWALSHIGPATRTRAVGAPALVTTGPYAVTRNPLYTGNLFIATGIAVAAGLYRFSVLLAGLFGLQYSQIISLEEEKLKELFNEEYDEYCAAVPALIPDRKGIMTCGCPTAQDHVTQRCDISAGPNIRGVLGEWPTLLTITTLFVLLLARIPSGPGEDGTVAN